jgi:CheY-like chemotaxis protein
MGKPSARVWISLRHARMLEKLGHALDVVADGHGAVEAVKLFPHELVLMDAQMPSPGRAGSHPPDERDRRQDATPPQPRSHGATAASSHTS